MLKFVVRSAECPHQNKIMVPGSRILFVSISCCCLKPIFSFDFRMNEKNIRKKYSNFFLYVLNIKKRTREDYFPVYWNLLFFLCLLEDGPGTHSGRMTENFFSLVCLFAISFSFILSVYFYFGNSIWMNGEEMVGDEMNILLFVCLVYFWNTCLWTEMEWENVWDMQTFGIHERTGKREEFKE